MYLIQKSKNLNEYNNWYRSCQEQGVPFIVVTWKRGYAKVQWDCITAPGDSDERISADSEAIMEELDRVYHIAAGERSKRDYAVDVGFFEKLSLEDAEWAAYRIFEILNHRIVVAV